MDDYTMWTEATRDIEAEDTTRRLTAAKVASASLWPFLAQAGTAQEFEMRLDLAMDRLAALAQGDDLRLLVESLRDDYELLAESPDFNRGQREVAASLSRTAEGLMPSGVEDEATAESAVDPQGGLDHLESGETLHMGRLALLKITTAAGDSFVIIDEESGYKIAGPFKSHADAAAALASGKYKGRNVKIEKRGEEDKKKENPNKRRDESGGSTPFREKGGDKPRKIGAVPGAPADPGMDQAKAGPDAMGEAPDAPAGPGLGGGGGGIPMSTKPRQMPAGGGGGGVPGQDPTGMGVDQMDGVDGGPAMGGAANQESGGASQDTAVPSKAATLIRVAAYIAATNGVSSEEALYLAQHLANGSPLNYQIGPHQPHGPITDAIVKAPANAKQWAQNRYVPTYPEDHPNFDPRNPYKEMTIRDMLKERLQGRIPGTPLGNPSQNQTHQQAQQSAPAPAPTQAPAPAPKPQQPTAPAHHDPSRSNGWTPPGATPQPRPQQPQRSTLPTWTPP